MVVDSPGSGAAASANGLPSESRHTAQRSPGWMTEPPNSRTRCTVAGRSATVKYGREAVSPGPGPREWTPRRRLPVSVSHPDPAAAGRGASSTSRTPCQNRRARSGSSAGNSIKGAGMHPVWPGVPLTCAFARRGAACGSAALYEIARVGVRFPRQGSCRSAFAGHDALMRPARTVMSAYYRRRGEDRVTEVLAAVLDQSSGLMRGMLAHLGLEEAARYEVRTQATVGQVTIDLEVVAHDADDAVVWTLWSEHKVDDPLTARQLRNELRALEARSARADRRLIAITVLPGSRPSPRDGGRPCRGARAALRDGGRGQTR